MKKNTRRLVSFNSDGSNKFNEKYVRNEKILTDYLSNSDREIIENKLNDIDIKIEDIGKICDKKKEKSYEDYNNVLKSNKLQYLDELTKLNFKLMEAVKQNTREDFLQKLKNDLQTIKSQVYDKDKELKRNYLFKCRK